MIRELKKQLKILIDPISKLAFETIPNTDIFPHVVGDLTIAYYKEGLYNISLDIDVWDKSTSTENVDIITEKIIEVLDRCSFRNKKIIFTCWFTTLANIQSEDKTLKRKTIKFEVQARKGEN